MSDRAFIATRKGLFTIVRDGGRWKVRQHDFAGARVSVVLHDPRDGAIYAALDHGHFGGKMHRSDDDGKTWPEVGVPVYPPKPDDYKPAHAPAEGTPAPWSLKLIWALAHGGTNEPGVIWAGTAPGGLFRSADRGATWELNRPLWDNPLREQWFGGGLDVPAIHSVLVDPRDPRHITLGVSCGGVWVTRDAGQTWAISAKGMIAGYMPPEKAGEENVQDPHQIVACPSNPDVIWCQHHSGIFRSADGAKSWSEIKGAQPSTFGFAVAVHPAKPDTAWFVPAISDEKRLAAEGRVVVTRTTDAGKTFTTLTRGLPQEHAYDLVFRHALDIDRTGNRLLFGSTTGSLWISENGGDDWTTVSSNLPPIAAVRFAVK